VFVVAQSSHYKSGFMHFWERELANQLIEEDRLDEAIVHVSVEECVEEQAYVYMATESNMLAKERNIKTREDAGDLARGEVQDWKLLEAASVKVGNIPIYRIGDSIARAEDLPNLYLSNMVRAIRSLVDGDVTGDPVKPAALFFDYLQAFPVDPEVKRESKVDQRRLQVREDVYRLRQAGAYFRCPIICAVQAKQKLDYAPSDNVQMPGMYDGEESSSIAQRGDRVLTLWMPKMTHTVGTTINHKGMEFTVQENMLFVKVAKQRGRLPSGKSWICGIDFSTNTIAPLDV
jgi:hypothetical protein